jgi:hypothetical protein
MTPEEFKKINEFLARMIYASDTSESMREAAKDARRSLFRLVYGTKPQPGQLHILQKTSQPRNPNSCAA